MHVKRTWRDTISFACFLLLSLQDNYDFLRVQDSSSPKNSSPDSSSRVSSYPEQFIPKTVHTGTVHTLGQFIPWDSSSPGQFIPWKFISRYELSGYELSRGMNCLRVWIVPGYELSRVWTVSGYELSQGMNWRSNWSLWVHQIFRNTIEVRLVF